MKINRRRRQQTLGAKFDPPINTIAENAIKTFLKRSKVRRTLPLTRLKRFPLAKWSILYIPGKHEGSGADQWGLRLPLPDARIISYTTNRVQVELWKQFGAK